MLAIPPSFREAPNFKPKTPNFKSEIQNPKPDPGPLTPNLKPYTAKDGGGYGRFRG
jgi:hypothetical protein